MLIILEGVDCSGKSTLAAQLEAALPDVHDVRVIHRGPPEMDPLIEYEFSLDDYVPGTGLHIICDRWHLGEDVYGPLYRNAGLDPARRLHIELYLLSRGALLVHTYASEDEILLRMTDRGEDVLPRDKVAHVLGAFEDAAFRSMLDTMHVTVPAAGIVDKIIDRAKTLENDHLNLVNFHPTYVGPQMPDVLILGEMRGKDPTEALGKAAFGPFNATSGHYLLNTLIHQWGRHGPRFGLANACEDDNLQHLWTRLGKPRVLTLGNNATKEAERQGLVDAATVHPQYVRRFHHKKQEHYGWMISEALTHGTRKVSWEGA